MPRAKSSTLSLRPAKTEDTPFLRALWAETRAQGLEATGWPPAAREAVCRGRNPISSSTRGAFDVVCPLGFYVARESSAVRAVEVTLLASCRQRGWGTALLQCVIEEGNHLGLPALLQVDTNNRAQRLYRRLDFRETGRESFHISMERPVGPLPD